MALLSKGIQVELLDLMVCALCQEEKRKNPNGYAMMRKVIASCPTNFQPFLERQLHQVSYISSIGCAQLLNIVATHMHVHFLFVFSVVCITSKSWTPAVLKIAFFRDKEHFYERSG
jgi:hypothetical protein